MSDQQQYAVLALPPPGSYRNSILSDALAVGDLNEYLQGLQQSVAHTAMIKRLDEGAREAIRTERRQAVTRTAQTAILADSITRLSGRLDAFEARRDEEKRQRQEAEEKADAAARAKRIQSALDDLHQNTGDLSPLPPKDPNASLTDDQQGVATRQEPDIKNLAHPPIEKHPQPLAVQLNEA